VLLATVLTISGPTPVGAVVPNIAPSRDISWLDIGDSYASGEGATGATGYCQQSDHAFGPRAAAILTEQRQWRIRRLTRTACTSHRVIDLFNSPEQLAAAGLPTPPDRPAGTVPDASTSLLKWGQDQAGPTPFDVVTMSFGGNDVAFAETLTDCLGIPDVTWGWDAFFAGRTVTIPGSCTRQQTVLEERVRSFTSDSIPSVLGPGKNGTLTDLYRMVASTMVAPNGVLVVAGYPRLFTPSSTWGRWRGGRCNGVSAAEGDLLGRLSESLDSAMRARVAEADGGSGRIRYVSRLELFDDGGSGKSLCGEGVEWLNTVFLFLRDGTLRKERGFHPNDLGNEATAERVAGEVEAQVGAPPPTTTTVAPAANATTTSPRVDSGRSTFDIGEDFDAHCTLAWPFAPSHGSGSTQFRTTCRGVPDQFLFVDVAYPGDLQLSSSRPAVHVRGQIYDIQKSEMGFIVLVVEASEVDIE